MGVTSVRFMVSYRKPGIKNLERRLLKYQLPNKSILLSICSEFSEPTKELYELSC